MNNIYAALSGIIAILFVIIFILVYIKNRKIKKLKEDLAKTIDEKEKIKINYEAIIPNAQAEAEKIINSTTDESEIIIGNARNDAKIILQRSFKVSKEITKDAYDMASRISSDVFEKINNMEELENTINAYENIIKGYKDDFGYRETIMLDEIAQIYGFTEAAQNLKEARQKTKDMVKNKESGECDYVEQNRKDIAVDFITDAFNGKVDSILSKTRNDNYDKLKTQINDAFYLVNDLGKAFRNARITKEFLENRLKELYWGTIVIGIKNKEREEQRRIKDEIKEEEKARKEREKALKDAQEKEKAVKEALEQAMKDAESASQEQKAEYEQRLETLKQQLKEAEENNKRTQSMAELTKAGHVYIISNIGSFGENIYKIGMTRRLEPSDRVRELGDASVPFPFDIHAMIYSENAPQLEYELHQKFNENQMNKVNPRKEFFKVNLSEIKSEIEERGIETNWTIKALATEYRESLELENSEEIIKENI